MDFIISIKNHLLDTTTSWCETSLPGSFILEPLNSFSSLIYVFASLFVTRPYDRKISSSLFYVGVGSFLFHARQNFFFQLLDEGSMIYLVNNLIRIYSKENFYSILNFYSSHFFCLYVITKSYFIFLLLFTSNIFILLYYIFKQEWKKDSKKWVVSSFSSLIFGKILWDIERNFCFLNKNLFILHSFWHFLSCASVFFLVKFNDSLFQKIKKLNK